MTPDKDDRHLGDFSAMQDAADLLKPDRDGQTVVIAASKLIRYARRGDSVADLEIERALRHNAAVRQIHARALNDYALARSEMSMAAAGGTQISRIVGAHRIELIEESGGVYLVIYLADGEKVPSAIEVRGQDGEGARLPMVAPINGIIQLRLDLSKPQPRLVYTALNRADSALFLL